MRSRQTWDECRLAGISVRPPRSNDHHESEHPIAGKKHERVAWDTILVGSATPSKSMR